MPEIICRRICALLGGSPVSRSAQEWDRGVYQVPVFKMLLILHKAWRSLLVIYFVSVYQCVDTQGDHGLSFSSAMECTPVVLENVLMELCLQGFSWAVGKL